MEIKFKINHPLGKKPVKSYASDTGFDIYAINDGDINREHGYIEYDTGISVELPENYGLQLRPRSSISKYDLVLCNSPGTIDNQYRGNIKVRFKLIPNFLREQRAFYEKEYEGNVLPNLTFDGPFNLYKTGDRIAQLVVEKVIDCQFIETEDLTTSNRNSNGFGSTGV